MRNQFSTNGGLNRASLNMPVDCPTCFTQIRRFDDGKVVDASKSSPYDGEFDPNIHQSHVCKPAELSDEKPF